MKTARTMTHITLWLALCAVIAVVALAEYLLRSWVLLALGAVASGAAYAAGRKAGRHEERAEVERLRAELGAAQDAARRAWDAAAEPAGPPGEATRCLPPDGPGPAAR